MLNPLGMLQAFDVTFDFGAGETGSKRAGWIAPQHDVTIRALIHYEGTGIRTIHGAGGNRRDHKCISLYLNRASREIEPIRQRLADKDDLMNIEHYSMFDVDRLMFDVQSFHFFDLMFHLGNMDAPIRNPIHAPHRFRADVFFCL